MIRQNGDDGWAPSPEQLAAYADGELEGPMQAPLKKLVIDWLREHPEARAEIEGCRRLSELWQLTAPPDPEERLWTAVWKRVQEIKPPLPVGEKAAEKWRVLPWVAALAGVAAILALALWLPGQVREWWNPTDEKQEAQQKQPIGPAPVAQNEPWPVVSADEVDIVRIEGADLLTLVVGKPPVEGPMQWAAPGEVWLASVQPAPSDDMVPNIHTLPGKTEFPMSWPSKALEEAPKE
jgi:hypothetical protein